MKLAADQKAIFSIGGEKETKEALDKLVQLRGAAFDREYVKRMKESHDKEVRLFQNEIDYGKNVAVKAFAEGAIPQLRQHLQDAMILTEEVLPK
jgi:putative membrane protein